MGDPYIQNGLLRIWIDELTQYGLKTLCYSASWLDAFDRFYPYLVSSAQTLSYPHLLSIEKISLEETTVKVRFLDSATINQDYYVDAYLTLRRGSYTAILELIEVYPTQNVRFTYTDATKYRFGYAGNSTISDDDLNTTGNNSTLDNNYLIAFDDAGVAVLGFLSSNQKPGGGNTRFQVSDGGMLVYEDVLAADIGSTIIYFGATPFSLITNLFKEAESATLGGGASSVVDAAASGGYAALLDAQNEYVYYDLIAGTHILVGRYIAVYRIRDLNQVTNDLALRVYNSTDSQWRNEENSNLIKTATAAYTYFSQVFDVTANDVSDGDTISLRVSKITANANEAYVDYFLIIPLGDGRDWPQDLAHAALLTADQRRRVFRK